MTERIQPNIFDEQVAAYVDVIREMVDGIRQQGRNVRPYGDGLGPSENLSPEENYLLYQNPAEHVRLKWPEAATDPTTGMPITNQQASQILLGKLGPQDYVRYVQDGQRLAQKYGGGTSV